VKIVARLLRGSAILFLGRRRRVEAEFCAQRHLLGRAAIPELGVEVGQRNGIAKALGRLAQQL
jgi:hypothetical protein